MPTLLQINETANSGSHGVIAENIGRLANGKGWKSIIAYGRWANTSQIELLKIGSRVSVIEHAIESRLFDNHGLSSRLATKSFLHHIDQIRPDIIHLHNIHGYYLNYRLLFDFLNSRSIPVIWTIHDCWGFTGHCAHFIQAGCEKWKTGCFDCELIHSYPKSFVDRSKRNYELKKSLFTAKKDIHIVSVSHWLAGLIRQSYFRDKDIRVIENGVDLDVFRISDTQEGDKFIILGVASVWTSDKGLQDFFVLREKLDRAVFEIVLIGLNSTQIRDLPEGIIGIKRTESVDELVKWYNRADVVLSLSRAETFGMTLAESMACGTPVIVYNNTALPEIVTDCTGYVVENGNIDQVVESILLLRQRTQEAIIIQRRACRDRAVLQFDKNKCLKQYLDLYDEVIK